MATSRRTVSLAFVVLCLAGCEPSSRAAAGPHGRNVAAHDGARGSDGTSAASSASAATPAASRAPAIGERQLHEATSDERGRYRWLAEGARVRALAAAVPTPAGFTRASVPDGSFGSWLRELPLRAPGTPVLSHRGDLLRRGDDPRIAAVAEIDVGKQDLQQCADAVIRLHAEWLWSVQRARDIRYHVTSGDLAVWSRYAAGERAQVSNQKLVWGPAARPDDSHATFRRYLDLVFGYAGSVSLARHSSKRTRETVTPGDFFVLPGGPGHAILILDVASDAEGRKVALLGQSYMPAQDFQVLATPEGPWFSLEVDAVDTPFWPAPFPWSSLRRLPD
jgi:hypothetical protein